MKYNSKNLARLSLLTWLFLPAPLPAQTNVPSEIPGRYLMIVDTSAAMRRRAPAVRKAVESLMNTSMGAQFRRGDTLGVWTFNDELQAGRLPLQIWTPETSPVIASNVISFISTQANGGASRFETVTPVLQRLVAESSRLTVLLISDGDEPISGTPFDWQIERALASKHREQQRARMPFVTVLRAVRGRVVSATVNMAPWPVEFPKFPPEPKFVEQPKPEPKPEPPPRPVVPSLIVIGNKKQSAATNVPPAVGTNLAPAAAITTPPPERQPVPAVATREAAPTNPPSAEPTVNVPLKQITNAADPAPEPDNSSITVTNPPGTILSVVEVPPVREANPPPAATNPEAVSVAPTPTNSISVVSNAQVAAPSPIVTPSVTETPQPPPTSPTTPAVVSTPETTAVSAPPPNEAEKPGRAAAEKIQTLAAATVTPAVGVNQATNSTGLAVAAPGQGSSKRWLVLLGGIVPIALGVGVFLYLQRRSRTSAGSLISNSMDRDRK